MSDSLKTEDINTVISEALEEGQTSLNLEPETALQKRPSMYENLSTKMSDQDTQQRINVFFAFIL